MSVSELGAIGELVGAVGVLLTLAYLAAQIRQNTHAVRAQIHQARSDQAQEYFLFVAGSREFSAILNKVDYDPANLEKLDPEEFRQLYFWCIASQQRPRNMHYQFKNGFLSEDFYRDQEPVVARWIPIWDALGIMSQSGEFGAELQRIRSTQPHVI